MCFATTANRIGLFIKLFCGTELKARVFTSGKNHSGPCLCNTQSYFLLSRFPANNSCILTENCIVFVQFP